MSLFLRVISLLSAATIVAGLGQNATLTFKPMVGALQLAGGNSTSSRIVLDGADWAGVIRTAQDLAKDFGRITGVNGTVVLMNGTFTNGSQPLVPQSGDGPTIMAGTIGKSKLIDSMVSSGKVNVSEIQGKWESFSSQLVANPIPGVKSALVIAGSNKRGSTYGMYDISEQMGVSPWYWHPKQKM